jgi:hypothetical protein
MRSRKFSPKTALARSLTKKNTRPSPSIQPRPIPPSREELGSTENCLPEVQIDFAELENGSLVEVVEDPNDPNHTLFAIFNHGHIRLAERVEDRERILVPTPRNVVGFSDLKLPQGVMPYRSVEPLVRTVAKFIRCAVDVPNDYAVLLAAFVLYTWRIGPRSPSKWIGARSVSSRRD